MIPALVYFQGLPGGFEFDDGINIVQNEHVRIESLDFDSLKNAALSSNSGPLRRPVAMLSFAVNYYFAKESVEHFKIVNIAIHSCNCLLVYFLSLLVFRRLPTSIRHAPLNAFGVALLWGVLPINLTSVLYVIQRMVSLGGTFALFAIICWLAGRARIEQRQRMHYSWLVAFLLSYALAVLTKETYILTGLVIVLLDWVLFKRRTRLEQWMMRAQVVSLLAVLICISLLLVFNPTVVVGDYSQRPFDMMERLLTQSRVLVFYVWLMMLPSNVRLALYHDSFPLSQSLFDPATTALSIMALIFVAVYAFLRRKKYPLLFLGVAWFYCWHLLESTILSLELVHEHRNYLASIGMLWLGLHFLVLLKGMIESKSVLNFLVCSILVMNVAITTLRAQEWSDLVDHAIAEVEHHPDSVRARFQLGRIYLILYYIDYDKSYLALSADAFEVAAELSDYDLLPWFGLIRVGLLMGEDVGGSVKTLTEKLEHSKIPASTIVALSGYQDCIKAKQCNGLELYYVGLVDALMKNKQLDKKSRSDLFSLKAAYYAEVLDDYDLAFEVLKAGVSEFPQHYQLRKSVLYYYVITGDMENAKKELDGFGADFQSSNDAANIVKEICGIFQERKFEAGC